MFRLGAVVSVLGIVAFLLIAGGVAAEGIDAEVTSDGELADIQELGTVEVTVVDQSGDGIGGVDVTAAWSDGQDSAETSSDGRALLDVPAESIIEFTVDHPEGEYVKNHQPVVESDVAGEAVTIEMAEPGDVALSVVDSNDDPVEGVSLRLFHENDSREVANATTDGNGVATVSDIEQRAYDVETLRAGYNTVRTNVTLDQSDVSETIEIESNRVDASFTVTDDHFEPAEPLEGAIIDIAGFGTLPPTFSDGTQSQSLPVNDEYEITVDKDGYDPVTVTLSVGEVSTSLEVAIQRTRAITVDQLQDAVVVDQPTLVTITNAYDEAVSGASVSLNGESVGETDAQGQIVFNVSAVGENELDASYTGLSASSTIVGVEPSADTPEDPGERDDTADADDGTEADDDETDDDGAESDDETDDDGTQADDGTDDEETADAADDGTDDGGTDDSGPGFGVLATAVALFGLTGLLARRH